MRRPDVHLDSIKRKYTPICDDVTATAPAAFPFLGDQRAAGVDQPIDPAGEPIAARDQRHVIERHACGPFPARAAAVGLGRRAGAAAPAPG